MSHQYEDLHYARTLVFNLYWTAVVRMLYPVLSTDSLYYTTVYKISAVCYAAVYERKEHEKTRRLLRRGVSFQRKRRCTSPSFSNSSHTIYVCVLLPLQLMYYTFWKYILSGCLHIVLLVEGSRHRP